MSLKQASILIYLWIEKYKALGLASGFIEVKALVPQPGLFRLSEQHVLTS